MTVEDVEAVLAEAIELGSANLKFVWEDSTPEEQAMMAGMAAVMRSRSRPVTVEPRPGSVGQDQRVASRGRGR